MSSWAARLQTAIDRWRQGDLDGAVGDLRAIVVSAGAAGAGPDRDAAGVVDEASHLLGRLLQERGDLEGARAAHRSVIAGGHPVFAQRSAMALGLMLVDAEEWALAHRPLRAAADGADTEIAAMAELTLVTVLRRLGDPDGAAALLDRARRAADPDVARIAADLEVPRPPEDDGEREREAWAAFESVCALLDGDADHAPGNAPYAAGPADPAFEQAAYAAGDTAHASEDTGDAGHVPGHAGPDETADGSLPADTGELALAALNRMLSHGMPGLCTAAAFRLYTIYADRGEFAECRRVMEHAIAVGDPAERGRAEKLLGAALFDLGENAEAREAYRRAAEDHRPEIRLDALIQESKFTRDIDGEEGEREARAILWRVVESGHPRFAVEARACLGQVYSEAGEVEDAVDCWRVVLDGDSEFRWGAVHFLGMLLGGLAADDPRRPAVVELLERAAEIDDEPDLAFQARLVLARAEAAVRGPDEEYERAVDDCDAALERLREGEVGAARALLRRVVDAGIAGVSGRAASMLATLEFGEGDPEQADELLEWVAGGEDFASGFSAAVHRLLIAASGPGAPHPVLAALVDHQRLGREIGITRYQECVAHADPSVAALAMSMLGQVYVSVGAAPRSQGLALLDEAAASGDPLALSHAAVVSWILRDGEDPGEAAQVIGLLRRARDGGHPALAPWVGHALGTALRRRGGDGDEDEALAAFAAVARSGWTGLVAEAEAETIQILEARGDLAGAAAVHERIVARGDRPRAGRSAWLLGFTRVRLDDLDAARAAFAQVPEDHPELAADGVFARRLLDGDFAGAAQALAETAERGEDHRTSMRAWLALEAAHAWRRAGDTASADAALSLAVEYAPPAQAQEAALFLGALRDDAGDTAGAAEAWARAAEGEDTAVAARAASGLGAALFDLGDLDGAAAAYRRALEAAEPADDDERTGLLRKLVRVLVAAGRAEEARAVTVEWLGDGPHVALTLGTALRDHGDLDAAAAELESLLPGGEAESGPDLQAAAVAGVLLAGIHDGRGDPVTAAEYARPAVDAFARLAAAGGAEAAVAAERLGAAAFDLGAYLTAAGDADGARRAYEQAAASSDPGIALPAKERLGTAEPVERAMLRLGEGDDAGALAILSAAYGTPLIAELHIALYHRRLADVRALTARAAGGEHAERAAALVSLVARDRLDAGDQDAAEAEELCRLVLAHGTPQQIAEICVHLAHARAMAGDLDAAVEALERGAAVDDPAALRCLQHLLPVLSMRGDHEELVAAARRAVASGDQETAVQGHWALGGVLRARGDLAGAVAELRAAAEHAAPLYLPYIQVELGEALYDSGDTDAAHRTMEALLTCDDPVPAVRAGTLLGTWLGRDGRYAGAAEALGAAAAAALRVPDPDDQVRELHRMALDNLGAVAALTDEDGDAAIAVRALRLAAAGGAPEAALATVRRYAAAAADRGDLHAARAYYRGAASLPHVGDRTALFDLAALLADHGEPDEARTLLESLASSDDTAVRPAATARLVPLLTETGKETGRRTGTQTGDGAAAVPSADVEPSAPSVLSAPVEHAVADGGVLDDAVPGEDAADGHAPEEGVPDEDGALLRLIRDRSGTPGAGEAGRRLIRIARRIMVDDPARARRILEMVVAHGDPGEVAVAHDDIGDIHRFVEDDMDAAVAAYRRGADVDHPAALAPLRSLLLALADLEDHDAVAETAQRAVTSGDPETVAVGYWLWGDARGYRGDADGAVRLYRRGVAAGHPDLTPRIRIDLARTLRERGEAEEAAAEIAPAVQAPAPEVRARAEALRGQWAYEDGDLAAAAEALGRVAHTSVDPAAPEAEEVASLAATAARNLAVVAERAYRKSAHEVAARALTLLGTAAAADGIAGAAGAADAAGGADAGGAPEAARRYAVALAEAGDPSGALLYAECLAGMLCDPSPDLEIGLADLYAAAGRPERAQAVYERLARHPDAEVRLVANGRLVPLLDRSGDAAALEEAARAIAGDAGEAGLDDGDRVVLDTLLGLIRHEQGDAEGALRTLRAAAESGEPAALVALGQALVEAGEADEAREVLGRVPETETRHTRRVAVLLARTHHRTRPERARGLYLRAVRGPGDADAHAEVLAKMYLGALAKRDRDWAEALHWYRQVIDAGVPDQAPLAAAHLGELAYWLGDRDSAVRYYELTLATGTTDAELVGEAAFRLGEIRHGDGDLDLAREHLLRAIGSGDAAYADQARTLLAKIDLER